MTAGRTAWPHTLGAFPLMMMMMMMMMMMVMVMMVNVYLAHICSTSGCRSSSPTTLPTSRTPLVRPRWPLSTRAVTCCA